MQKEISLKLKPDEAGSDAIILSFIASSTGLDISTINGFLISKKSIDARSKQAWVNITLKAFINEPYITREKELFIYPSLQNGAKKVIIVGAGPAGLFAALELIQLGIQPIIIERGKDIKARRRDLAKLNKEGIVNPESNYCFGEGGAGTYSDGKLYTRSSKRGNIDKVLQIFYQFGADENVLYQSHPHIGTNKLPQIIAAIRQQIIDSGGIIYFEKKLVDIQYIGNKIQSISTADGGELKADAYILATGHSARDIFELLDRKNILIESKPFALGVRIEHPQQIIDAVQYHSPTRNPYLPPASYSLVEQVNGRGVFSFCMCPGGIIAPAATNQGELVVNGWSPSKRNNPFANSGMVVQVTQEDALNYFKQYNTSLPINSPVKLDLKTPLLLMHFQQAIEQKAFIAGGGNLAAPAQRMEDFCNNKHSSNLPKCSYNPGLHATPLNEVLPTFICKSLQDGFNSFGKKMRGFFTNEAVIVATESRTSSPVRIPRDTDKLSHPQLINLYPCAEGAGYAGGIVSAAMDGQKVALCISQQL